MIDAVVLLSGGLDSTTLLAYVKEKQSHQKIIRPTLAVSFSYGQKHYEEVMVAEGIAADYGCLHRIVELPRIFGRESTVLQDGPDNPHLTYQQIAEAEGPSPTVVPFRNANLISQATTIAVTEGASWVYAGMHAEDARNWAYPDCTPEFLGAMANAVRVGTYDKVRLATPFQWMMKADIVQLGFDLGVPFEKTLSCYEGAVPACGRCPTCVERLAAFAACGEKDPLEYA